MVLNYYCYYYFYGYDLFFFFSIDEDPICSGDTDLLEINDRINKKESIETQYLQAKTRLMFLGQKE